VIPDPFADEVEIASGGGKDGVCGASFHLALVLPLWRNVSEAD
jgi:hypothetical protein